MKSMTGYGLGKAQNASISLEASLRAVNGRFLEIRFHLPKEYIPFETELKKLLQGYFERGTIDLFISRKEVPGVGEKTVVLNKKLAQEYMKALKSLEVLMKSKSVIHLESLARFPDVLVLEQSQAVSPKEKQALIKAVTLAIKACDQERLREGVSVKKDLEHLLDGMEKQVELIQKSRDEVNQGLQEKFIQKIKTKLPDVELDQQRILQEIVLQIEKSDINEELNRLSEHLQHYRKILQSTGGIGKKLDFYTQELLREVNTIGSKSNVSILTMSVVEAKSIVEKLREQVQNVE